MGSEEEEVVSNSGLGGMSQRDYLEMRTAASGGMLVWEQMRYSLVADSLTLEEAEGDLPATEARHCLLEARYMCNLLILDAEHSCRSQ